LLGPRTLSCPLLFLAAFACALIGLNPTFYADDSPEFPTAAAVLGIVHPPGYPLYTLLERLTSLLPLPSCFCANLVSAFCAALICVLLFCLLNQVFHFSLLSSLCFALVWMAGVTTYPGALSAKMGIYELTGVFLLALILGIFRRYWNLAAFLFGLSLTNHWMSMGAYTPGLLFLAFRYSAKNFWDVPRILKTTLFGLMGLSLYLYLPLRASQNPLLNWGTPVDIKLFLEHVLRYIAYHTQDLSGQPATQSQILLYYLVCALREFWGTGLLAFGGLWFLFKTDKTWFGGLILLWGGLVSAVTLLQKCSSLKLYLINDYSISSMTLLLLLSALGARGLFYKLKPLQDFLPLARILLLLLVLGCVFFRISQERQTHYTYNYDYTLNAWKALPRGAVLFCPGDSLEFPTWYFQWVEHKRPDLSYVGPSIYMDWYRIDLAQAHPDLRVFQPIHQKGETYWHEPLERLMLELNPQKECYFSDTPNSQERLDDLNLAPAGLVLWATLPPKKISFYDTADHYFWENIRTRNRDFANLPKDLRTHRFLESYSTVRRWKALYEIQAASLDKKSSIKNWYEKSLEDFLWTYNWNHSDRESAMNVGANYLFLGEINEARDWISRASGEKPTDAELIYDGGVLAYQAGSLATAKNWFKKSLEIDPSYSRAKQALEQLGP
jgi:hypothetical protein